MKNEIENIGHLLLKYPNDPLLRGKFITFKKNFWKSYKKAQADQREQILHKIQTLEEKNPNEFLSLVNKIKNKTTVNEHIEPDIFLEYFKELHNTCNNSKFDKKFAEQICESIKVTVGFIWLI